MTGGLLVLVVDLVPASCWASNVRTVMSPSDWDHCKWFVRRRSGDRCEVCGGRGPKWPVECHEIWTYINGVQRLEGLVALCPDCHEVKHFGRAERMGRAQDALCHLMNVNRWSEDQAVAYLESAFALWRERSEVSWDLDLSWLEELGITPVNVRSQDRQIEDYS